MTSEQSILERNISALKEKSPELADLMAPLTASALPFSDVENRQIRGLSQFSPDIHGLDAAYAVVLLGLVNGEALEDVYAAAGPATFLLLCESSPERFARLICFRDVSHIILSDRVSFFLGQESHDDAIKHLFYLNFKDVCSALLNGADDYMNLNFVFSPLELSSSEDDARMEWVLKSQIHELQVMQSEIKKFVKIYNASDELVEYLGKDKLSIARDAFVSPAYVASDWHSKMPSTPNEIHSWYMDTPFYILELHGYHISSPTYPSLAAEVEQICASHGGAILDFGGGDGDMVLRLTALGLDAAYCDVPGKTMEYALWRFKKRGLNIPVHISDKPDTVELNSNYDIILALDVFEHLPAPLHYCKLFFENLNPSGILVARPSFSDDNPLYPMHLKENAHLDQCFDEEMMKIGFIKQPGENEHITVWLKP